MSTLMEGYQLTIDVTFQSDAIMFLTCVNLAKKAKADRVIVLCKSVATGHGRQKARPRLGDKLEFIDWDPTINKEVLYREDKKIRSLRDEQVKLVTRLKTSNNIHNKWPSLAEDPSAASA